MMDSLSVWAFTLLVVGMMVGGMAFGWLLGWVVTKLRGDRE